MVSNIGAASGQMVFHPHIHLIPRNPEDRLVTLGKSASSMLAKEEGDSMIEAGIHEGDLVIVERGREPKQGDIVIAEVDGEWTMKYYTKKRGKIILQPANKKYPPIEAENELRLGGVVTANVRKY